MLYLGLATIQETWVGCKQQKPEIYVIHVTKATGELVNFVV